MPLTDASAAALDEAIASIRTTADGVVLSCAIRRAAALVGYPDPSAVGVFVQLVEPERLLVAVQVAGEQGPLFDRIETLLGARRLVGVRHRPSG